MFFVYVLWSDSIQRYYVGSTVDVSNRLREHNAGESASTQRGFPWEIVYVEELPTRGGALRKENQIKSRGIRRYLESLGKSREVKE